MLHDAREREPATLEEATEALLLGRGSSLVDGGQPVDVAVIEREDDGRHHPPPPVGGVRRGGFLGAGRRVRAADHMVDSAPDWQPPQLLGGSWLAMWSTGKMRIERVIWLDGIVDKLWRKHRVEQHEVVEVLDSRPLFRFVEAGLRSGENLYLALGQSEVLEAPRPE